MIKLIQNASLKPYNDINIDLRRKAKKMIAKKKNKWMNNAVFGKSIENVRKHRDIKLVTTERRKSFFSLSRFSFMCI